MVVVDLQTEILGLFYMIFGTRQAGDCKLDGGAGRGHRGVSDRPNGVDLNWTESETETAVRKSGCDMI